MERGFSETPVSLMAFDFWFETSLLEKKCKYCLSMKPLFQALKFPSVKPKTSIEEYFFRSLFKT